MAQPHTERTTTAEPVTRDSDIRHLLDDYSRALSRKDAVALSALWEFPALVLSDKGGRIVNSRDEARKFYEDMKEYYAAQGMTGTRPQSTYWHWLTDRIAIVEVRWPYLNGSGEETGSEMSTYTLRRGKSGRLRVQGLVLQGSTRTEH